MVFITTGIRVVCDRCSGFKGTLADNEQEAFNFAAKNRGFRKIRIVGRENKTEKELMLCLTCLVELGLDDTQDKTYEDS